MATFSRATILHCTDLIWRRNNFCYFSEILHFSRRLGGGVHLFASMPNPFAVIDQETPASTGHHLLKTIGLWVHQRPARRLLSQTQTFDHYFYYFHIHPLNYREVKTRVRLSLDFRLWPKICHTVCFWKHYAEINIKCYWLQLLKHVARFARKGL